MTTQDYIIQHIQDIATELAHRIDIHYIHRITESTYNISITLDNKFPYRIIAYIIQDNITHYSIHTKYKSDTIKLITNQLNKQYYSHKQKQHNQLNKLSTKHIGNNDLFSLFR